MTATYKVQHKLWTKVNIIWH